MVKRWCHAITPERSSLQQVFFVPWESERVTWYVTHCYVYSHVEHVSYFAGPTTLSYQRCPLAMQQIYVYLQDVQEPASLMLYWLNRKKRNTLQKSRAVSQSCSILFKQVQVFLVPLCGSLRFVFNLRLCRVASEHGCCVRNPSSGRWQC